MMSFFGGDGYSDMQFTVKERTQWLQPGLKEPNYVPLKYTAEFSSTQIIIHHCAL